MPRSERDGWLSCRQAGNSPAVPWPAMWDWLEVPRAAQQPEELSSPVSFMFLELYSHAWQGCCGE